MGDEVLGFTVAAAYADHVVVPAGHVTAKPAGLPWEVAGALSAVGQTAHHAVRELGVAPERHCWSTPRRAGWGPWRCSSPATSAPG